MENCCLCKVSVSSGEEKKRRKKLHGVACKGARESLDAVAEDAMGLHLEDFVDTSGGLCFLCRHCDGTLTTIQELQNRLLQLRDKVKSFISSFKPLTQEFCGSSIGAKRRSPSLCTASSPKRICLDPPTQRETSSLSTSPAVKVKINYPSGSQVFTVNTPSRKAGIKQYARRSYKSLASTVVAAPITSDKVVREIARTIRDEMKNIGSMEHDSILRDSIEAVMQFSWDTVFMELKQKVPTLIRLLSLLVRHPSQSRPFIACVASQVLKDRHPKLGLAQRAISVFLYGNGATKQVYTGLSHLNVCLSHSGTQKTLKRLCVDHDIKVQYWSDTLKSAYLEKKLPDTSSQATVLSCCDSDSSSINPPAYSPVSDWEETLGSIHSTNSGSRNSSDEAEEPVIVSHDSASSSDACEELAIPSTKLNASNPASQELLPSSPDLSWTGFKIVGDNLDKNIRPSLQRLTHQTRSLHYFHSYAVKDRVNLSSDSDVSKSLCQIIVSRILVKHMPQFKNCAKEVVWHIPSKFSEEMSMKSEVVPLGVQLWNENKLDEMAKILDEYHSKYVPMELNEEIVMLQDGRTRSIDNTHFHKIFLGGDQLTVARVRGTQSLRVTHDTSIEQLSGVVPVIEDWHARLTFMKVVWNRMYSKDSLADRGTMYQLRNLLNRSSIPTKPEKNMKAVEDFLMLLLHSHVIAAAEMLLEYDLEGMSVGDVAKSIVNTHLLLPLSPEVGDGITLYARELLTLGLIWLQFYDATREGDGDRILLAWKVMIPIFKATNHTNYLKEAVNLLYQAATFSERRAKQLLWSRCINTKGRTGHNLPCDLHMEHLNRRLKGILHSLGANITPQAVVQAGQLLATVDKVCSNFEVQTSTAAIDAGVHNTPAFDKDLSKILDVLKEVNVFEPKLDRRHQAFSFKKGLLQTSGAADTEVLKKVKALVDTFKWK